MSWEFNKLTQRGKENRKKRKHGNKKTKEGKDRNPEASRWRQGKKKAQRKKYPKRIDRQRGQPRWHR